MPLVKRMLIYVRPYLIPLCLSIFFAILFATANVYFLPLTKDIVKAISKKELHFYFNQIANLWILVLVRVAASKGQLYVMNSLSNRMTIDIRTQVYQKLLRSSQHFYSKWKLGELVNRLFSDTSLIQTGIMMIFKDFIPQTITLIAVFTYLITMNWKLTLFTLITIPIFVTIIPKLTHKLKKATTHAQSKLGDITHISQEVLGSIKLVQAYNKGQDEGERFKKENYRFFKAIMRGIIVRIKSEFTVEFLQYSLMTLVVGYGGYQVTQSKLEPGELISFFTGILLLIDPVVTLSKVYTKFSMSAVSAERIFEILDLPPIIESPQHPRPIQNAEGRLDFHNVNFQYTENSEAVLQDISFHAEKGKTIALVGLSGAGKSTLMNLIPRFYDPSSGSITLDGIPLPDIDLIELRHHMALVPQDDILFRGSILDNIRYSNPNASEADAIQAAKQANAWEFIDKMPGKLRAIIGDRGQRLSGGQRQRISIARAILKNPKILLLDEATSALDSESEKLVQDALIKLMKNRTTIVIAHRLSTIMHADQIIVLEDGRIKESGTHQELLEKSGVYAKLYHIQFEDRIKQ